MKKIKELCKASFVDLRKLIEAREIAVWQFVVYGLFLSLILAIPMTTDFRTQTDAVIGDLQEISKQLPDFSIENGELKTQSQVKVIPTNDVVVTFDAKNERSDADFLKDTAENVWGVAFRKNELLIFFPKQVVDVLSIENKPSVLSYKESSSFQNLTSEKLREGLQKAAQPLWLSIFIYFICIVPAIFQLAFSIFVVLAIFGMMENKIFKTGLKYFETVKIMLFALTAPIVLTTVLCFFLPEIETSFLQIATTFFLYVKIMRENKKFANA